MATLALAGVSASGQLSSVGAPGLAALTLPVVKLAVSGQGAIPDAQLTWPMPQLAIAGAQGGLATVALTLPPLVLSVLAPSAAALTRPVPKLAVIGAAGVTGAALLTLPVATLAASAPNSVRLGWPAPTLAASARTGAVAGVVLATSAPSLRIQGNVPFTATAALLPPAPQLAIVGSVGQVTAIRLALRALALASDGYTGTLGTARLTLPVLRLGASGYEAMVGRVQLVLPRLQLVSTGARALVTPASTAANTIAMHTEAMALSTYSNFPFNSFAAFNGVYLGACANGLFVLSGDTDNGALIQAAARSGISDFGTSFRKRVDRIYVGYRTNGNLVLRVFTDEIEQRDYLLRATGDTGLHGNHARLGKGVMARYWQFEVRNQNGADFDLNMIELKPTRLQRRVGGRDA